MTVEFLEQAELICVDWGSSNFRAFLLNAKGELIDSIYSDHGMLGIKPSEFEPILFELLNHWPQTPIILAGMVGSLNGWRHTEYVACPVDVQALSTHLTQVENSQNRQIYIISGIECTAKDAQYDVARGEETQIFGAMQLAGQELPYGSIFCLPGTHSKWMHIQHEKIINIITHMTGELFDILIKHSILAPQKRMSDGHQNDEIFIKGIGCAMAGGGLAHHIFSARTNMLNGEISSTEVETYLSGILIGTEIKEMQHSLADLSHVYLVGNARLNRLYALALGQFNIASTAINGEKAAYTGMRLIANRSKL